MTSIANKTKKLEVSSIKTKTPRGLHCKLFSLDLADYVIALTLAARLSVCVCVCVCVGVSKCVFDSHPRLSFWYEHVCL